MTNKPVYCNYILHPSPDDLALDADALSISWTGMYASRPPSANYPKDPGRPRVVHPDSYKFAVQLWFPELLFFLIDTPMFYQSRTIS